MNRDISTTTGGIHHHQDRKKVIIIGAGFAGLSAAYHLLGCGANKSKKTNDDDEVSSVDIDVEILEARNRVGGRVYPYDLDGTIVDVGGQWIHEASKMNPIRQLMETDLGIPFHSSREDNSNSKKGGCTNRNRRQQRRGSLIFDENGKLLNDGTYKKARRFYYKIADQYNRSSVDINTSMQDLLDNAMESRKRIQPQADKEDASTDNENENEFQKAINCFCFRTEMYEGGRLNEISVYLDDLYESMNGPDEVPEGTYKSVLDELVKRIGKDKFRLNSVVKRINYEKEETNSNNKNNQQGDSSSSSKVQIYLENVDEPIIGDYCICTVPLGVLQHRTIDFVPPLSDIRWNAIDSIGMGCLDKIALKFDTNFWSQYEDQYDSYWMTSNDISKIKNFYDCSNEVGGAPVLLMFYGGNAARRVDSPDGMSDNEAIEEAMKTLRCVFGKDIPRPVASHVTRWNMDPYSYGAYSFTKIGSTQDAYDEISTPIGNTLYFAGEHTSKTTHSCVHGAWITGEREALRILGRMNKLDKKRTPS